MCVRACGCYHVYSRIRCFSNRPDDFGGQSCKLCRYSICILGIKTLVLSCLVPPTTHPRCSHSSPCFARCDAFMHLMPSSTPFTIKKKKNLGRQVTSVTKFCIMSTRGTAKSQRRLGSTRPVCYQVFGVCEEYGRETPGRGVGI